MFGDTKVLEKMPLTELPKDRLHGCPMRGARFVCQGCDMVLDRLVEQLQETMFVLHFTDIFLILFGRGAVNCPLKQLWNDVDIHCCLTFHFHWLELKN